jgi:Flp pilus assembly protein TadD
MKCLVQLTNFLVFLLLILLVMGCAGNTDKFVSANIQPLPQVKWQSDDFTLIEAPQVSDIFYLNEDRKQHFLSFYQDPINQTIGGHKRLAEYLDVFLSGFSYKGDTYNADLASTKHAGNCLSLAILTKAYASLVGLKIEYRLVNSAPVYTRKNGIMTISSHVQTHVYAPAKTNNKYDFFFSKVIIDYFPSNGGMLGGVVDDADFVSMYYQNLAAKALLAKDFDKAYSLLSVAMQLSINNIETLNTLAVLYKKSGNQALAESIYLHVLEHTKGSVSVLRNYVILLEESGRDDEVTLYEGKYMEIEDDNPYRWFDIANDAYGQKKYSQALRYFQKTADMAPYLHESYFGLAKTYYQLGYAGKAKLAMRKAAELAYTAKDEMLYNSKLQMLNNSL